MISVPILFIAFNRPHEAREVFEAIRIARPSTLYIAVDGPRKDRAGDLEQCILVRNISNFVDWPCKVNTLFHNHNLGCKRAVVSAIDWFFSSEEMGIILEDDCVPSINFFRFCEELLYHYKEDTRIWHIGGTNPLASRAQESNLYYFSNYNRIWGWATWRRAWDQFNVDIPFWPSIHEQKVVEQILGHQAANHFNPLFWDAYNCNVDTWDYQWFLYRLLNGLSIIPMVNLVANIGFNTNATHTVDPNHWLSKLKYGKFKFPISHPQFFVPNSALDNEWINLICSKPGTLQKLKDRITKLGTHKE
jgi:hypothetical protein